MFLSPPLFAKEKAEIEIHVAGEAEPTATFDTTTQAEVILPAQNKTPARNVNQLLEKAAGIHLKKYGGLDDFSAVSIRGSTTDQVLIYLDGVLLNSATGGPPDLSFISLDQIEKIEIYRGGAPGKIADSTPGGVIYLHSKKGGKKTANKIRASAGSFWTLGGGIEHEWISRKAATQFSLAHSRSRGDFLYLDDRGTHTNTGDDRLTKRQNNDFQSYDFGLRVGNPDKAETKWQLTDNLHYKRQGVPGFGGANATTSRLNTLHNLIHFEVGKNRWRTDFFFDATNSQFADTAGQIGVGAQDSSDNTFRFGPQWTLTHPIADQQILTTFLAHRGEFFLPNDRLAGNGSGTISQRHMLGTGLEDEILLMEEKLVIDPSIRGQLFFNHYERSATDQQLSGKLGLQYRASPVVTLKSNVFRGFRQPTFGELFGDRGTLVGNPDLAPEQSLNVDGGITLRDRIVFSATYFRHSTKNLIQFLQTSQFTAKAQNLNSALIHGAELALTSALSRRLDFTANYLYQFAKDTGANSPTKGRFLPGRPKHQVFMESGLQFSHVRPFAQLDWIGHNYLDSQNLQRVGYRTLLASGLVITPKQDVKISATAKNLLNSRISDVVGYPLPGRSYWGEAEWRF